jgi:6,7-dimethyl-8-ribityllumazine synthase
MKKTAAIVVSRFNESITQNLLSACLKTFKEKGVTQEQIEIVWVPGAFEIPLMVQALLKKNKNLQGVITLGCVIEGETDHFRLIVDTVTRQISDLSLRFEKPIIFEVLATKNLAQAVARSSDDLNNKGRSAALSFIDMIKLLSKG